MVAPHYHTTAEAKAAIKKIEHNSDGGNGAPTGIAGGSAANATTHTDKVTNKEKGADWVGNRKV